MALEVQNMLARVLTKALPADRVSAFAAYFAEWVRTSCEDNQTRAGEQLGMSQSHVSALIKGARGPGLNLLIAMRRLTGHTIDQMLGLDPLPVRAAPPALDAETAARLFRAELAAHDKALANATRSSKRSAR